MIVDEYTPGIKKRYLSVVSSGKDLDDRTFPLYLRAEVSSEQLRRDGC